MSVSRARAVAFDVLRRVEVEGAFASDLLHSELTAVRSPRAHVRSRESHAAEISPPDAALATELALGVLRWRRLLDFLLARHLKQTPSERGRSAERESQIARLDLPVAIALRMGLYQLLFLERIPPRAAVNESVELVKRARKTSAASLVNAVLRHAASETGALASGGSSPASNRPIRGAHTESGEAEAVIAGAARLLPPSLSPADRLGILHSHPTWLVDRWLARFGEQRTRAILMAQNRAPRLTCAMRDTSRREETIASLEKSGLLVEPGALLRTAIAVRGGSIVRTDAFRQGRISIQDEASQLIPVLPGVRAGERVLDLCAAPGGKTPFLDRGAGESGFVVTADRHAHRLRAMREQFHRLGLSRIGVVQLDASRPLPWHTIFQRILVDAPCSGTGTLARHPEIRWRLKPDDLEEFHRLQTAIITSALDVLAPGGRLVYSTCSLEPEENEEVIEETLNVRHDVQRVAGSEIAPLLSVHLASGVTAGSLLDASGYFRTIPGIHPTDGFFAATLEKRG
jgi:16S rRNA (cytosine967-C5)-methyltransferase